MYEVIRTRRKKLVVWQRPSLVRIAFWLAMFGLFLAVFVAPVPFVVLWVKKGEIVFDSEIKHLLVYCGVLPGALLVVGFAMLSSTKRWVFKPAARTVHWGGLRWSYEEIGAVVSQTDFVREAATGYQTGSRSYVQSFQVGLLVRDPEKDMVSSLEEVKKRIAAALNTEDGGLDTALQNNIENKTEQLESALGGDIWWVFSYKQPLAVWKAGERLAKELDVPLVDMAGDRMVVRTPEELDMSLREKLRQSIDEPAPKPAEPEDERLQVERSVEPDPNGSKLSLAYKQPVGLPGRVIYGVPLGILAVAVLWSIGSDNWVLAVLAAGLSPFLMWGLHSITIDTRRCVLEINADEICFHQEDVGDSLRMTLDELEMLRINTTLHNALYWISDERMVEIPMPIPIARRIEHEVEAWLARKDEDLKEAQKRTENE